MHSKPIQNRGFEWVSCAHVKMFVSTNLKSSVYYNYRATKGHVLHKQLLHYSRILSLYSWLYEGLQLRTRGEEIKGSGGGGIAIVCQAVRKKLPYNYNIVAHSLSVVTVTCTTYVAISHLIHGVCLGRGIVASCHVAHTHIQAYGTWDCIITLPSM